jgi:DNA-binding transcriptional MerR regulator
MLCSFALQRGAIAAYRGQVKMRDLEQRTGVNRETIRVYLRNGLLPDPARPKPNVADYDESHVLAIQAVRKLQRNDGLTLPQIKVALSGQSGDRRVDAGALRNLEALIATRVGIDDQQVLISTLTKAWPHAGDDANIFEAMGLIAIASTKKGPALSITDSRIVTIWQQMRAEGYTEANGFPPTIVDFYKEPADMIARQETRRFIEAVDGRMDDSEAAAMFHAGIRHMIDFFALLRIKGLMRYIHFEDAAV